MDFISRTCVIFETLPSKIKFYSSLSSKKISKREYIYAFKVWDKFEMNTIMICNKCDVLLLADIFEKLSH